MFTTQWLWLIQTHYNPGTCPESYCYFTVLLLAIESLFKSLLHIAWTYWIKKIQIHPMYQQFNTPIGIVSDITEFKKTVIEYINVTKTNFPEHQKATKSTFSHLFSNSHINLISLSLFHAFQSLSADVWSLSDWPLKWPKIGIWKSGCNK